MIHEEYWQQFTQSGRIEDYLAFKGVGQPTALNQTGIGSEKQGMEDGVAFNGYRSSDPLVSGRG